MIHVYDYLNEARNEVLDRISVLTRDIEHFEFVIDFSKMSPVPIEDLEFAYEQLPILKNELKVLENARF